MATPTGLAIFGVGRWGVHLLRNFLTHPQATVVAVVDSHAQKLEAAAQQFALPADVVLTSDWRDALDIPGLEAVVIATPAVTHHTLIWAALERGYHVLAEKPLTLDYDQSRQLCQFADRQQRQLVVDHTYLFHPAVERGRQIVRENRLGRLRYGYAVRTHLGPVRQDVDALWDLAIHDIAIFNSWLGQTPFQVEARGTVWLQPGLESSSTNGFSGLADLVWLTLTYGDGFQATIHLCWANPDKQRRLCLVGNRATLIFDELASQSPLRLQQGEFELTGRQFVPVNQREEAVSVPSIEPLSRVCDHFLTCVQHNQPSTLSSGWLGADLVQILAALTESLKQGGMPVPVQPGGNSL